MAGEDRDHLDQARIWYKELKLTGIVVVEDPWWKKALCFNVKPGVDLRRDMQGFWFVEQWGPCHEVWKTPKCRKDPVLALAHYLAETFEPPISTASHDNY